MKYFMDILEFNYKKQYINNLINKGIKIFNILTKLLS